MANIALLGHGVVGTGVVNILSEKSDYLTKKFNEKLNLKYILVRHDYDVDYKDKFVTQFDTILNDDEVDIVVEAMGGKEPAYTYLKAALLKGKHVVTSNKELVAQYGDELMNLARDNKVNFLFEAAVRGAIPVIHNVRNCFGSDSINRVAGILNGTTNYILTKMTQEGLSFEQALSQAQELGYAEADPTADVEGIDACRKICILADIIFGSHIYPEKVITKGIRDIRMKDAVALANAGGRIKLLGVARKKADCKVYIITQPFALLKGNPLTSANDVFNAVALKTDFRGELMFYGRGAGSLPTASAVLSDILECVKYNNFSLYEPWRAEKDNILADSCDEPMRFFVSVSEGENRLKEIFGEETMLIPNDDETAFITHVTTQRNLSQILTGLTVKSILPVYE